MPWLRIDDKFPRHPKVASLSDRAFRLYMILLCYCAEFSTDGAVDKSVMERSHLTMDMRFTARSRPLSQLLQHGLITVSGDGWRIHDFLDYNPDAASVKEKRDQNRERQRQFRERRNGVSNALVTGPRPDPSPKERLYEERKPKERVTHSTGDPQLDKELGWQ